MAHKVNTVKTVRYVSKNFATGLTDVTLNVRTPSGTLFDFGSGTDLVLTEGNNGEYQGSYTPDTLGVWQEKVTSSANGDEAVRSYEVTLHSLDSIGQSMAPGGHFSH